MTEFVLASRSPRRQMLLRNLVDHFIVVESDVKEQEIPGEGPAQYVVRVAKEKARSAGNEFISKASLELLVIAADTVVVDGKQQLGKPKNAQDAKEILTRLRGKTHQVLSGITLYHLSSEKMYTRMVRSDVSMRDYSDQEIQNYIASGDPFDKAGAYAIQNEVFNPAPDFNQCYANVMGLPLCHLATLCRELDLDIEPGIAERCQVSINYQCSIYHKILAGANGQ
jgi:MAF protein